MNKTQLNILCVLFIVFILLTIFPPWVAYKYATVDGKGLGNTTFVGFHFILSDRYEVLGETPYFDAEINYKLWGILYLSLLHIGFFTIIFFRIIKIVNFRTF